jgi:hypothetical protein
MNIVRKAEPTQQTLDRQEPREWTITNHAEPRHLRAVQALNLQYQGGKPARSSRESLNTLISCLISGEAARKKMPGCFKRTGFEPPRPFDLVSHAA